MEGLGTAEARDFQDREIQNRLESLERDLTSLITDSISVSEVNGDTLYVRGETEKIHPDTAISGAYQHLLAHPSFKNVNIKDGEITADLKQPLGQVSRLHVSIGKVV